MIFRLKIVSKQTNIFFKDNNKRKTNCIGLKVTQLIWLKISFSKSKKINPQRLTFLNFWIKNMSNINLKSKLLNKKRIPKSKSFKVKLKILKKNLNSWKLNLLTTFRKSSLLKQVPNMISKVLAKEDTFKTCRTLLPKSVILQISLHFQQAEDSK